MIWKLAMEPATHSFNNLHDDGSAVPVVVIVRDALVDTIDVHLLATDQEVNHPLSYFKICLYFSCSFPLIQIAAGYKL